MKLNMPNKSLLSTGISTTTSSSKRLYRPAAE